MRFDSDIHKTYTRLALKLRQKRNEMEAKHKPRSDALAIAEAIVTKKIDPKLLEKYGGLKITPTVEGRFGPALGFGGTSKPATGVINQAIGGALSERKPASLLGRISEK